MCSKEPIIINSIPISYETKDYKISFCIEFGKAKEPNNYASVRTNYDKPYEIEKYVSGDKSLYFLLAEEGPFAIKVYDINVISKNNIHAVKSRSGFITYNYGIIVALDMKELPIYTNPREFVPLNHHIRYGVPWVIHNKDVLRVDQNGDSPIQWSTKGVLENGETSGMLFLTFQAIYSEESNINNDPFSKLATVIRDPIRISYKKSNIQSSKSSAKVIEYTRYVLPICLKLIKNEDIKQPNNLKSKLKESKLEKENEQVVPFNKSETKQATKSRRQKKTKESIQNEINESSIESNKSEPKKSKKESNK